MKKKLISFLLCFTLIASVSLPAFGATYSDLEGHWAQKYIEALVSKGLMSGYDDGTIRPENSITVCETLALLSRFYTLTDLQSQLVQSDYKDFVNLNVPSSLSWAYDEISVCLAAGIITQSELKSIDLTSAIEKEKLAVFLVRTMKMEKAASNLTGTKLTFADADKITTSYKGHVALLVSLGIVNGDTNNNFGPKLSVTRAIVAKMVSVSLDYLKDNNLSLALDSYTGLSQQEGIISSISGRNISMNDYNGLQKIVSIPADATVTVNGTANSLTPDYAGCFATITSSNGSIIKVAIESSSTVKWVQGTVSGTAVTTEVSSIYVTDKAGTETNYTVAYGASITQGDSTVLLTSLAHGYVVTLKIENNLVTKIIATSGDVSISGTVSQITFGSTVALNITDDSGTKYGFSFNISSIPTITRGSNTITIDRIQVGSKITLTIKSCSVTGITMTDTGTTVTGTLASIISTQTGISWALRKGDGTNVTYELNDTAAAFSGTTSIAISTIKVGDTVSVVVYGNIIDEVYLQASSISTSNQVTGSILLVNSTDNSITVLNSSGKLVYLNSSNLRYIIVASSGSAISLSALSPGSQIVAYGSYSTSTSFAAKVMIVLA